MTISLQRDATLLDAAFAALKYFEALDRANAAIHCARVRYSPITFRLAEGLDQQAVYNDRDVVRTVMSHSGQYAEDQGR